MISEKIAKAGRLLCVETAGVSELAVGVVELAVDALRVLGVELEVRAIYRLLIRRFGPGCVWEWHTWKFEDWVLFLWSLVDAGRF